MDRRDGDSVGVPLVAHDGIFRSGLHVDNLKALAGRGQERLYVGPVRREDGVFPRQSANNDGRVDQIASAGCDQERAGRSGPLLGQLLHLAAGE
jgi:hypothetical protein